MARRFLLKDVDTFAGFAHAMHTYHFVALGVAPKKAKLAEAQAELEEATGVLNEARAKLAAVVEKLEKLEEALNAAVNEKKSLSDKEQQCKVRLSNADKLIGGLGGERVRWTQTVADLTVAVDNCIGDILISAGFISYLGPFTAEFRSSIGDSWRERLIEFKIQHTEGCDITQTLVEPVKLRIWQMYGLPTDPLSTQNGIMLDRATTCV